MKEIRIDVDGRTDEEKRRLLTADQLMFRLNMTMPHTKEYDEIVHQLFPTFGEGSFVSAPISGVDPANVKIGSHVGIMPGCLFMASGGITIDDDVRIGANVQLISNNHDLHNRNIITCLPIHICRNAWIGAGATILRGVTIGENSVVGAMTVVTKDVPANTIVVGNPARVIREIE